MLIADSILFFKFRILNFGVYLITNTFMKILVTFILLFAYNANIFAQDTVFYRSPRERVNTKNECDYYSLFSTEKGGLQKEIRFSKNDIKESEIYFIIEKGQRVNEGSWKTWYSNGQLESVDNFHKNVKEGAMNTFWGNGEKKREDIYKHGSLVSGNCYNNEGVGIAYFDYEIKPQFPGGEKELQRYLKGNIHYPQSNYRQQDAVVLARFIDSENGQIKDVEIVNKTNEMMQNEVRRVINKMPTWISGKEDGNPVSEYYLLHVSFSTRTL